MKIINNNPYRQLGVYSTSSQKEVVANQGKIKAFLKVGRQVSFPLDLNGLLPEILRTEQSIADATSKLALPAEQLKYAQFWFFKCTKLDDIACGKLTNGDLDGAIEIWNKKATVSSLQNLLVCALITNQLGNAINYAQTLYSSYSNEFVKIVLGDNGLATSENLVPDFLNVMCEEFNSSKVLGYITNSEWKEYVGSKNTKPIIDKISSSIDLCKSSRGKGATARLNAGSKLMNETKADLIQLKQFVSATDLQYQMIADKLGLEILQCGIDYFNDSDAADAANKAMVLQKYAQSIVVGKIAKERCKENVDILVKIIAELPPLQVFSEDRDIKVELRKFYTLPYKITYSVDLLNATKPYLLAIKSKLGSTNSYYLKVSTQVVGNALRNIIEEVNAIQSDSDFQINMIVDKAVALSSLKSVLRSAWNAMAIMDTFDMESDFRNSRYNENRRTLSNMCSQVGVSTHSMNVSLSRSSSSCSSSSRPDSSCSSSPSSRTTSSTSSLKPSSSCNSGSSSQSSTKIPSSSSLSRTPLKNTPSSSSSKDNKGGILIIVCVILGAFTGVCIGACIGDNVVNIIGLGTAGGLIGWIIGEESSREIYK